MSEPFPLVGGRRSRAADSLFTESAVDDDLGVVACAPRMKSSQFEGMKRYVDFDDASSQRLRVFHPLAEPDFVALVDDFYDAISRHPQAKAAITGGEAQVQRLKKTLIAWLSSLLLGPHDEAYLTAHSRIGRVHVRINLPQEFMFTAISRIRAGLLATADRTLTSPDEFAKTSAAINQMLDLELAIMLDTYRQDWLERVRVSERLATIGQLAASIGHELRNPLGVVQSSLFLLQQRTKKLDVEDAVIDKHHQRIASQVDACGKTISSLLELARENPPHKATVLLNTAVAEALSSIQLPEWLRLTVDVPPDLAASADPSQLRQVIRNLVTNGIEALERNGSITIRATSIETGVELWVTDDGPGIEEGVRDRIFDVLFTTRANGTGLGLALCRKIIQAHGGELELVASDSGACFRVWLPNQPSDDADLHS